jgi:hypothetical protein
MSKVHAIAVPHCILIGTLSLFERPRQAIMASAISAMPWQPGLPAHALRKRQTWR